MSVMYTSYSLPVNVHTILVSNPLTQCLYAADIIYKMSNRPCVLGDLECSKTIYNLNHGLLSITTPWTIYNHRSARHMYIYACNTLGYHIYRSPHY